MQCVGFLLYEKNINNRNSGGFTLFRGVLSFILSLATTATIKPLHTQYYLGRGGLYHWCASNRIKISMEQDFEIETNNRIEVLNILGYLPPRMIKLMALRYGLHDGVPRTLEEVARYFHISRERVRQLVSKNNVQMIEARRGKMRNGALYPETFEKRVRRVEDVFKGLIQG